MEIPKNSKDKKSLCFFFFSGVILLKKHTHNNAVRFWIFSQGW